VPYAYEDGFASPCVLVDAVLDGGVTDRSIELLLAGVVDLPEP
jgi:hypothetical protein